MVKTASSYDFRIHFTDTCTGQPKHRAREIANHPTNKKVSKEHAMIDKTELCRKIIEIYPDIGACGIDVEVEYDDTQNRWTVRLHRGSRQLKTYLEEGDAELCLMGKQCVSLGIEIKQLSDNIDQL
jgi:hypothetical protein